MNVTEPFVLKRDVLLIPVAQLSDDVRRQLTFEEGDYTLSQRYGRTFAQVIDGGTAALLELFRRPRTIVEAILANSRDLGRDAEERLDEMLPHLGRFLETRILVPAGTAEEDELRPRLDSGGALAGWTVVRCVKLLEDTEIYQLRRGDEVAALKIARVVGKIDELFANEAEVLRHLDGSGIAPRLLHAGNDDGRTFLIIEWIDGVDSATTAAQRRHDRAALAELCASIAAAYATLHARGVLHGDVHPRNVFAGERGATLLDFGHARFADQPPRGGRGGVYTFFEPEYFSASAPVSPAGEQYALGALLYLLANGRPYLDFRLDRAEMEAQIQSEPPRPFAMPWPELEPILRRALEKDPARRHASVAEMAALLAEVRETSNTAPLTEQANALLESTIRSFSRGGAMFDAGYTTPPTASINYGCAGAAVGLLRIATARGDGALLALADVWRSRAAALIGTDGAYHNDDTLSRRVLGDVTPYHTESGIHAAAAMVAAARGDTVSQRRAVAAFIAASSKPCDNLDLTLGRSGTLLACAMLLDLGDDDSLRAFGTNTMHAIWRELDARAFTGYLGMAHGWSGYLYAAMRWCTASGDALPSRLLDRLGEHAAHAIDDARGACWPVVLGRDPVETAAGWCNGSAGHVFVYTLAHRLLSDARWLDLAERAAWSCWQRPAASSTLCCGSAGRAYALLNLYKHTGDGAWLRRARELANHAASAAQRPQSLWKGELGVAVLIADLAAPENARMPFFE